MKLSGYTNPFAVLGHPIGHSLSPIMHNAAFKALKMDAIYLAFDVEPQRLMNVLTSMGDMGFRGVNLTVPLKEVAFNGLNVLDDSADKLGAVNTVEFTQEGMRGHNTDGKGFVLAIEESFKTNVRGLSVFVLGCGGAGRAVAITCATEGAGHIILADLDDSRTKQLAGEISQIVQGALVDVVSADSYDWEKAALEADLIIQASPVGMKKDDKSLLSCNAFRKEQMVFDLVYMYPETDFMKTADSRGADVANGLGMLLHQGARAFSIWTGKEPAVTVMREALEQEVYIN